MEYFLIGRMRKILKDCTKADFKKTIRQIQSAAYTGGLKRQFIWLSVCWGVGEEFWFCWEIQYESGISVILQTRARLHTKSRRRGFSSFRPRWAIKNERRFEWFASLFMFCFVRESSWSFVGKDSGCTSLSLEKKKLNRKLNEASNTSLI